MNSELVISISNGDVNSKAMTPRNSASLYPSDTFMTNRLKLRHEVYGKRCDRPLDTVGGIWNKRIDAGEVLYWTRLSASYFA